MNDAVFRHGAVLNPNYGNPLVRRRQQTAVVIRRESIEIGRQVFLYRDLSSRHFEDGVIELKSGDVSVLFAVEGIGTHGPDPAITEWTNVLIDAVLAQEEEEIKRLLGLLKSDRTAFVLGSVFLVIWIVVLSVWSLFLLVHFVDHESGEFFVRQLPKILLVFVFLLLGGGALSFGLARAIVALGRPR